MTIIDVREESHQEVLDRAETALAVDLDRASVVYGESGATEGYRTRAGTWVRIERRGATRFASAWVGLEAASAIGGVTKPAWFQSATWADPERGVVWRVDEVELITVPMVADLRAAAELPDVWWSGLRESLAALARHQTDRVGMSQAHVTRRITEVFGDEVDTRVDEWTCAHTDVHWDNLSVQGHLIDWEDWGNAPRGLDAACLWQASLGDADLSRQVRLAFGDDLDSRSGTLAMLVQCANAIRAAARRGEETSLSRAARTASTRLLALL